MERFYRRGRFVCVISCCSFVQLLFSDGRLVLVSQKLGFQTDASFAVEINSVVYTFGFCLKTRLSSYSALSRMSIDTGNPLCS